jgi:hypothetical protein
MVHDLIFRVDDTVAAYQYYYGANLHVIKIRELNVNKIRESSLHLRAKGGVVPPLVHI